MDGYDDPYLRTASQAVQTGELDKAKRILTGFLDNHPEDPQAWFLLSGAVTSAHDAVVCLQNVLALEPGHEGAHRMLTQVEAQNGLNPLEALQIGPDSGSRGETCPFCLSNFAEGEAVVACPLCETVHHLTCWQENVRACAASNCDGFSVRELVNTPMPLQPPKAPPKVIVITKDDIPQVPLVSRKQKEHRFQRQLLLLALMAEEGMVPPDRAAALPSVQELMTQYQRDLGDQPPNLPEPPTPSEGGAASAPPPVARAPVAAPYQASGVVQEVLSIWPSEPKPGTKED